MESSKGSSSKKQLMMVEQQHRCNSESFIIDEQPSWLDDLLSEATESKLVEKGGHRRSASDTFAYVAEVKNNVGASWASLNYNDSDKELNGVVSQAKPSMSKPRAKQQSAHRSRVRKLQHIAELERRVQALQADGCELSAELEFVDQHNIILSMENRALRQRLDSLSQEQLIKHLEQEMLERELTRLQTLFQIQKQQLQPPPQQHRNHSKHRRNKSRDLESQFANLSIKNNDATSSTVQVTGSIRL